MDAQAVEHHAVRLWATRFDSSRFRFGVPLAEAALQAGIAALKR